MKPDTKQVFNLAKLSLNEDIPSVDLTTTNLIPPTCRVSARIVAGERCVVAGLGLARYVFKYLDRNCVWRAKYSDGDIVRNGRTVATITGLARAILTAERTALNFLGHLSGIATLTRRFVERVKGSGVDIYDTRKTAPGLRVIEKYAVRCGRGHNHRMNLSEMVLIKDNHIKICRNEKLPLGQLISFMRGKIPRGTRIEIEVQNLRQLDFALKNPPDIIMLDNMDFKTLQKAVGVIRKSGHDIEIEVSGRVNLKNIERIARLKVDRISTGEITHSAPAMDFSLEII